MSVKYVQTLFVKFLSVWFPFKFGIDEEGKYGYYTKEGEFIQL